MIKYMITALTIAALSNHATANQTDTTRTRSIIMIFDGLRPDYITPENMPRLYAFKQKSAYGNHNHSIIPTVTRVNASSYSSGSYPGKHGILGNTVYFPQIEKTKGMNTGNAAELMRIEEATHGHLLTTTALGEILEDAGERMMVFSSGTSGQAFLQNHKVTKGAIINPELVLPASFKPEVIQALGEAPAYAKPNTGRHQWVMDAFFKYGLVPDGPLVSAIWLSDPDGTAHATGLGSPQCMEAIKSVDFQFGRILDSLESKQLLFNIIVSADHGFVTHIGKQDLTSFLIEKGFKKDKTSDDVVITDDAIYVKDHDANIIRNIVAALQQEEWVGALFTAPKKPNDLLGWVDGTLSFENIHWNHAERRADILAVENWNDAVNSFGYKGTSYAKGIAGHGGSSPYEVHIPLIAGGPAFKTAYESNLPTSNVDIVPTLLYLLRIPSPAQMDGRVMVELLKTPPPGRMPSSRIKKVVTSVEHPWGTYKIILEKSVLGPYNYVNETRVERK